MYGVNNNFGIQHLLHQLRHQYAQQNRSNRHQSRNDQAESIFAQLGNLFNVDTNSNLDNIFNTTPSSTGTGTPMDQVMTSPFAVPTNVNYADPFRNGSTSINQVMTSPFNVPNPFNGSNPFANTSNQPVNGFSLKDTSFKVGDNFGRLTGIQAGNTKVAFASAKSANGNTYDGTFVEGAQSYKDTRTTIKSADADLNTRKQEILADNGTKITRTQTKGTVWV